MLGPAETTPVASVWNEQLERHDLPEVLFDKILDRAIDHRLRFLVRGEQAPGLTVELILAMFKAYKTETTQELSNLEWKAERAERYYSEAMEEALDPSRHERMLYWMTREVGRAETDLFTTIEEGMSEMEMRAINFRKTANEFRASCGLYGGE